MKKFSRFHLEKATDVVGLNKFQTVANVVYFFTIYLKLSEIDVSLLDVERPLSVKPSIFVAFAPLLHVGGPHWGPSILEFAFRVTMYVYYSNFTDKSFSEALILASTNPQQGKRLFMELP